MEEIFDLSISSDNIITGAINKKRSGLGLDRANSPTLPWFGCKCNSGKTSTTISDSNNQTSGTLSRTLRPRDRCYRMRYRSITSLLSVCAMYLILLAVDGVYGFNLDIETAVVHRSNQNNSMYGFSVAQTKDQGYSWILVGAPKYQSTQTKIVQGGAVLKCPNSTGTCVELFHQTEPETKWNGTVFNPKEQKSGQWFGASLSSSLGRQGVVVACAPRYIYYTENLDKREPVGTCYVWDRNSQPKEREYSPCRNFVDNNIATISTEAYNRLNTFSPRHGMLGYSANVAQSKDGTRILIGAVGSYYWQGQLYSINLRQSTDRPSTKEGSQADDDSYLGYSGAFGYFASKDEQGYASGMPRGNKLVGKVVLFDVKLRNNYQNLTGEQLGAFFGYAVAVGDFNGDGKDDIAVSAPFYTDLNKKSNNLEVGRVYIYQTRTNTNLFQDKPTIKLDGTKARSQFGLALSSLQDVNLDGMHDLLVGAPYDGKDGNGAIYVYLGSALPTMTKPSQVIYAEDIDPALSAFGFSLSAGVDMDNNLYPDTLVGAYTSDRAVYIRSRPILKITSATITISPDKIDLEAKQCTLTSGLEVPCVNITACFSYTGISVPTSIDLNVAFKLDADKSLSPRLRILSGSTSRNLAYKQLNVSLEKDIKMCHTFQAYLRKNVRDKLTHIVVEMNYNYIDKTPPVGELRPILDQKADTTVRQSVNIQKQCGKDNICIPNLILTVRGKEFQVFGDTDMIEVDAIVENIGEGAYESFLLMEMPAGVNYVNVKNIVSPVPVSCEKVESLIRCDIGNPLPARAKVSATFILTPKDIHHTTEILGFNFSANSSNPEDMSNMIDNSHAFSLAMKTDVSIKLQGASRPGSVTYNKTYSTNPHKDPEMGPEAMHLYEVVNSGRSIAQSISVDISWPSQYSKDNEKDYLLYLLSAPSVTPGKGICQVQLGTVNPENITIVPKQEAPAIDGLSESSYSTLNKRAVKVKRQASDTTTVPSVDDSNKLDCTSAGSNLQCITISCVVGPLAPNEGALIQLNSRAWADTFFKYGLSGVLVTSHAVAKVIAVPYTVKPARYHQDEIEVSTEVNKQSEFKAELPSIWIIVGSVLGGLIVLLIIVVVLWRCGFFKRQRPSGDEEAKEPLNSE